jgi:Helix-hairpin-helix domain
MIRGIGPVYARRLVQAFGEAVFDTVEEAPERPQEVTGIGPKRAERIRRGWADQKVIREIMLFLHGHTPARMAARQPWRSRTRAARPSLWPASPAPRNVAEGLYNLKALPATLHSSG